VSKTKAEAVVEISRRRELEDRDPDARYGFRARGTHGVVVLPPYMEQEAFGGGNLWVQLTPGRDLPFNLLELRRAISNRQTEARKDRFDRPGQTNS
jgi:hypothetical protein